MPSRRGFDVQEKPIEQRVRLSEVEAEFLEEIRSRRSLRNASEALRYCISVTQKSETRKRQYQRRQKPYQ